MKKASTEGTEKDFDQAIDDAFKKSKVFSQWFLKKTKFANENASYLWSRSDNPWGRFTITITNSETGIEEEVTRDSETDILVVYENADGNRFALHIENKLANGKFTEYQPESYAFRAEKWKNQEKFGNYNDFETILISPLEFYRRNFDAANVFDRFVSYEEISIILPAFSVRTA